MYIDVGGHQLHLNCTGHGSPTVIFESGLGGSSLDWVKVQARVSLFTRACSYDRAGYGWSESAAGPRNAERLAADFDKLLVYGSLKPPFVLVGHSIGGVLIRRYAERMPDKVAGMVLVDSSHEEQFKRMEAAGMLVAAAPARGATFIVSNYWQVPSGMPAELRLLARQLAIRPAAVRALYLELAELRGTVEQRPAGARLPDVPLAVIMREPLRNDRPASKRTRLLARLWLEMQKELARETPGATLLTATGSGHHVHLDRPEMVVGAVQDIVDKARQKASFGAFEPLAVAAGRSRPLACARRRSAMTRLSP